MLLVLDNYDSFTYNLVQYAGELGAEPVVYRNDALTVEAALALQPKAIVISPGPCTPREAGISVPLVRAAAGRVPVLGVCLGHQAIGEAFGGRVVRADRLMHGKTTMVRTRGIPVPRRERRPSRSCGTIHWSSPRRGCRRSSRSPPGRMTVPSAARSWHCATGSAPVYGVQFHPESVATKEGKRLLANFLELRCLTRCPPIRIDDCFRPSRSGSARLLTPIAGSVSFRDARPWCHSGTSWLDSTPQQTAPAAGRRASHHPGDSACAWSTT